MAGPTPLLPPVYHIIISYHHLIISSYHRNIIIISSHQHNIVISSYHHNTISPYYHSSEPKSASQFWPKSQEKNRNRLFYPSTKSHRELIFSTSGMIFRDEYHGNAQKITAPPNRHFTMSCFVMTFETLQNLQTAGKSRG